MNEPRYVVRENSGYPLVCSGSTPLSTAVWVSDTWDCWREVATAYTRPNGKPPYAVRRSRMERIASRLNAEHEAKLRSGAA